MNTDEGPKPAWTAEVEDFTLMRYTLKEAAKVAEPRGIRIGLKCHQQYSAYFRTTSVIFTLQKCGPHIEQKCAGFAPSPAALHRGMLRRPTMCPARSLKRSSPA